MRTVIQLDPAFWVHTPVGDGRAVIYETDEDDWYWVVVLDNGAIVKFQNNKIRAWNSYTLERGVSDERMKEIINGHGKTPGGTVAR